MPLILAAMIVARNPAQYGMDIEPAPVESPNFEKVTLAGRRRPAARRGVGRHVGPDHPGSESGASPLDDAGSGERLRAEGAGRARRKRCERLSPKLGPGCRGR